MRAEIEAESLEAGAEMLQPGKGVLGASVIQSLEKNVLTCPAFFGHRSGRMNLCHRKSR